MTGGSTKIGAVGRTWGDPKGEWARMLIWGISKAERLLEMRTSWLHSPIQEVENALCSTLLPLLLKFVAQMPRLESSCLV